MNDRDGRDDQRRNGRSDGGERRFGGSRDKPEGRREGGADKPFRARSHGTKSHAGVNADGTQKTPRSHGKLSHDRADAGPVRTRREEPADDGSMRIAKRLARAGISSRRDAEGMIADGRVSLNGKVLTSPAIDVTARDRIEVDGAPLPAIERTRLWLFHKPAGLVTTNRDPEGRATVFDQLPPDMPRVLSIGRLDINTEGLLLLTNDGGLARTLELPATGWLRRYRVRAHGDVKQEQLDELRQGIAIDGVFYGAVEATLDRKQGSNVWLMVGLREGKNREVKRILGHLGLEVNRLIRVSFGPFQLGDLSEGAVMEIKGRTLRDQLGERLIAESGADFDAPIVNEFSNKPVKAEPRRDAPDAREGKEWISASDARPNKKKMGEAKRTDALGRLDTRPPRPERSDRSDTRERGPKSEGAERKPRFGREERDDRAGRDSRERSSGTDDRPKRAPPSAGRRSANVWMAPGARALGDKKRAEQEERKQFSDRRESGFRSDRNGDKPRGPRPAGDRPRRDGDAPRAPRDGDRPRWDSDKPRSPRPAGDRPRRDGDAPRAPRDGDRPRWDSDKPRPPRPSGDRPRPTGDKPRGPRRDGDRPRTPRGPRS
ncbi:pseudouridine synthase [Aureimonas fodinaquatilis]|uniref:Pseudouridine synthase n=1 Tax=Aureimonas fodinaquatilis TaxID=2565783 RepID=A0A5B0E0K8_9HYPH|nr:pseudouridine synthase [Aureimonas fodinaquatilis]KAA0972206.1 pseudouridine synthase [Aureimonas fodinaquatilis]